MGSEGGVSANLYWSPIRKGKDLPVNAPSSFIAALGDAMQSEGPWTLMVHDVPVLRGLAAGLTHEREAITAIIDAIEKHGEIRVWAEY